LGVFRSLLGIPPYEVSVFGFATAKEKKKDSAEQQLRKAKQEQTG